MTFLEAHMDIMQAANVLSWKAKKYIMANHGRVEDWSRLVLHVKGEDGYVLFCNHDKSQLADDVESIISQMHKDMHNPVRKLVDPVLDDSDGDFSVYINDTLFLQLSDEAVAFIADYIEENAK